MGINLLLLRHGLAGDRESFSKITDKPDYLRPLTAQGKKEIDLMARQILKLMPRADVIFVSPYTRALETAKILSKLYKKADFVEAPELQPMADAKSTWSWLKDANNKKVNRTKSIIMVGHQPHLGDFLSFILTSSSQSIFDIEKGGFALVNFEHKLKKSQAKLICFMQPSQVRKLRKK